MADAPRPDFMETVAAGVATNLVTAALLFLIAQASGLIGDHPALTVVAAGTALGYALLGFWYWSLRRRLGTGDLAPDDPRMLYEGDSPEALAAVERARQLEARHYARRERSVRAVGIMASFCLAILSALAAVVTLVFDK